MGRQWALTGRVYKALRYLLRFCCSFEFNYLNTPFWEKGTLKSRQDRETVCSHRLSIFVLTVSFFPYSKTIQLWWLYFVHVMLSWYLLTVSHTLHFLSMTLCISLFHYAVSHTWWLKRIYKKYKTQLLLYLHHLATICDASFDWGLWASSFGEEVVAACWRCVMGPLSSPVVTSHRLLILRIDLSLTVFTLCRLVMDRLMDRIGLAKGSTSCTTH